MTKRDLIEGYYKSQESGSAQWYQRWSTRIDLSGRAYMRIGNGDPEHKGDEHRHYPPLDGLIEHDSNLEVLRRWEWFAIRNEGEDTMQLYRFTAGDNQQSDHLNAVNDLSLPLTRCFCIFRSLFKDAGGFNLRDSEALAAERAASDLSKLNATSYR
jgi:hypothetical protein